MAQINFAARTIRCRIAIWGAELSGKKTTLRAIRAGLGGSTVSESSAPTAAGEEAPFLDITQHEFGKVAGMSLSVQLCVIPPQSRFETTRRLLLGETDAILFVADSDPSRHWANLESLADLMGELEARGQNLGDRPVLFQYNKRDLPDAMPIEKLQAELNPMNAPTVETVATTGQGVSEGFRTIMGLLIEKLNAETQAAAESPPAPAVEEPKASPAEAQAAGAPPSPRIQRFEFVFEPEPQTPSEKPQESASLRDSEEEQPHAPRGLPPWALGEEAGPPAEAQPAATEERAIAPEEHHAAAQAESSLLEAKAPPKRAERDSLAQITEKVAAEQPAEEPSVSAEDMKKPAEAKPGADSWVIEDAAISPTGEAARASLAERISRRSAATPQKSASPEAEPKPEESGKFDERPITISWGVFIVAATILIALIALLLWRR